MVLRPVEARLKWGADPKTLHFGGQRRIVEDAIAGARERAFEGIADMSRPRPDIGALATASAGVEIDRDRPAIEGLIRQVRIARARSAIARS